MRNGFLPALGALLIGSGQLLAQPAPVVRAQLGEPELIAAGAAQPKTTPAPAAPTTTTSTAPALTFEPAPNSGYRSYASVDYLLWWLKGAPLPTPLVTTGNPADALPGAIGQPGTNVLLGNQTVGFSSFSGMRFTVGSWLNCEGDVGIEATGFFLERRTNRFYASSDNAGSPILAFPFANQTPGFAGEDAAPNISDPRPGVGGFAGNVLVVNAIQLWGAEVNGAFLGWSEPGLEMTFLVGFRYLDLQESLHITNRTNDITVVPNNLFVLSDQFGTRNQFYGGQVGVRYAWQSDRLSLAATGKIALGSLHETVDIQGNITSSGPTVIPGTTAGGFYAEPSNIGRRSSNSFAVLPSLELKAGYQITERVKWYIGYDVLYINQVVRPGNQIDRNINATQNATLFPAGGVLVGTPAPAPLFNRTDFWAQGINFGLELKF